MGLGEVVCSGIKYIGLGAWEELSFLEINRMIILMSF